MSPRTSSPVAALFEERVQRRQSRTWRRRRRGNERLGKSGTRRTNHAVPNKLFDPLIAGGGPADRLQARHRTAPVDNHNRNTALDLVDERAQAVLGVGDTDGL